MSEKIDDKLRDEAPQKIAEAKEKYHARALEVLEELRQKDSVKLKKMMDRYGPIDV